MTCVEPAEPIPRRDPDHCAAGHDLRVCGVYSDSRGYQRCRKCQIEAANRCNKRRRFLMKRKLWLNQKHPPSAGDG